MSPRSSVLLTLCIGAATLAVADPAAADAPDPPIEECIEQGEIGAPPPSCILVDGEWVATETERFGPDMADGGSDGVPAWFVALGVLAVVGAIGVAWWRLVLARNMARRAGMNENEAMATTFLADNGLAATFIASSLRPEKTTRPDPPTRAAPAKPERTAYQRMSELQELKQQGLVTDEEYESRRQAILDSL